VDQVLAEQDLAIEQAIGGQRAQRLAAALAGGWVMNTPWRSTTSHSRSWAKPVAVTSASSSAIPRHDLTG